jgi:hypothetical protein
MPSRNLNVNPIETYFLSHATDLHGYTQKIRRRRSAGEQSCNRATDHPNNRNFPSGGSFIKPASGAGQVPERGADVALKYNEGLACEAIVRHLENRANGVRTGLRWPEDEQHAFPVEAAFKIGDQLYALEHTGIEPFGGHMQMEAQATRLFAPIEDGLKGNLDTAAVFQLHVPVNAFRGQRKSDVGRIQQALIGWVKMTAPTVQKPLAAYTGHSVGPVDVPGVPFPVSLYRYEPPIVPGRHFEIRHIVAGGERARIDRINQAIVDKFPKLVAWKRHQGAKSIFVLESNDVQLTNPANVTETFVPQANARDDRPDETYLVMSCMNPWLAFPILIGDKTYFDLARENKAEVYWKIDNRALTPLTKR